MVNTKTSASSSRRCIPQLSAELLYLRLHGAAIFVNLGHGLIHFGHHRRCLVTDGLHVGVGCVAQQEFISFLCQCCSELRPALDHSGMLLIQGLPLPLQLLKLLTKFHSDAFDRVGIWRLGWRG